MKLNLTRPLVVFDLETTGLDIVRDRIFQLSYIKVYPDGKEERENIFVNPGKEIPQEVVELTGTSNADVADKPRNWQRNSQTATSPVLTPTTLICRCSLRNSTVQASTTTSASAD